MHRTAATLARWAALYPGTRMPDSISELPGHEQIALQQRDEQMYALLSNSATAELELAVLNNSFAPEPPDPAAQAEAARRAQVEELLPKATEGNYTALLQLDTLDPVAASAVRSKLTPDPALIQQQQEDARERDEALRRASFEMAVSRGGY